MRSYRLLFALLLALCAVVLFAATLDEVPSQRGMVHPDYETMQQGGAPEARHGSVLWLGWTYGALAIAFFVGLIDLSLAQGGAAGPTSARRTIWVVGAALELVFLALILSYRSFMLDPLQDTFLFFPKPTAWMMYGIWGLPMVFVLLYIFKFETWILTPEQEAAFAKLEASKDAERRQTAAEGGRS